MRLLLLRYNSLYKLKNIKFILIYIKKQKIPRQKKPVMKLRDALAQNKLAFPLMVLIEQQKASIVHNTEIPHLKLLGDLYPLYT